MSTHSHQSPSFHRLAALAHTVWASETGAGNARDADIISSLKISHLQLAELVEEAQTWGILEADIAWTLTRLGAELGSMVEAELEAVAERSINHFAHYTSYLPRRWWPED